MWKLMIVDDDERLLSALVEVLARTGRYQVYGATSVAEARSIVEARRMDVVLLDVALPDESGARLLVDLRARFGNEVCVIMMSGYASVESAAELVKAGADACVCKPFKLADIDERIRTLVGGRPGVGDQQRLRSPPRPPQFTPQEAQVLAQMRQGKTNRQIAKDLRSTPKTVENHVASILKKLGVANRTEAVALSYREDMFLGVAETLDP